MMVGFLVAALVSAALVRAMIRVGRLDVPGDRSSHSVPTPKGGGVGILAAFAGGCAWWIFGGGLVPGWAGPLVAGAVLLGGVSYLDDVRDWPFVAKLAAQVGAAGLVLAGGLLPRGVAVDGAMVALPAAVAAGLGLGWLLYITNATNFMDGLNGLAAGCVAIVCVALCVAAPGAVIVPAGFLAAGIGGFLPFNYPRARIFMGDVGSQVCGFVAGSLVLAAISLPHASLVAPLALAPLILDVGFTLARRLLRGENVTRAHRGHLYQVGYRSGVAAPVIALIYWGFSGWGALCGVAAGRGVPAAVATVAAVIPIAVWGAAVRGLAKKASITRW
jgi:UDP-GlcNAc:undecaprenyl-phosphate GlcNAc-1-phosphate transferase